MITHIVKFRKQFHYSANCTETMTNLTEEDRNVIVDMFASLDVNGDGRVNLQELLNSKHFYYFSHKFNFPFKVRFAKL